MPIEFAAIDRINYPSKMATVASKHSQHNGDNKMKMTAEHYKELKSRILPFVFRINDHIEDVRKTGNFDSLEKRILWDVFHAAKIYNKYSYQEFNYLDSHIETAMKSIFKDLLIEVTK